jgi:preprotein translocase subunit SecG
MYGVLLTIHILVAVFLIISILLQAGKGSDLGAVFGGSGSQALFGTAGPMDFIKKATIVLVVLFMVNSLLLGYVVKAKPSTSVMTSSPKPKAAQTAPAPAGKPAVPAATASPAQQAKPAQPASPQQSPSPSK